MCLIISVTNKLGKSCLPEWLITSASQSNADGIGLMFWDQKSKKVITHKSVKDYDSILALIPDTFYTLHFRYSTHGGNSLSNTHPFEIIKDTLYVMHNGIIAGYGNNTSKYYGSTIWKYASNAINEESESDTVEFLNTEIIPILKDNPDLILNKGFQQLLANRITSANKLVFQYKERTITINADQFHNFEGDKTVKCSNTYAYKKPKTVTHKDVFTKGLITRLNKCQLQDLKIHELEHIAKKLKTDIINLMSMKREDVLQNLYECIAISSMNNDIPIQQGWDHYNDVLSSQEYLTISNLIIEACQDYDKVLKLNLNQRLTLEGRDLLLGGDRDILASDLLDRALESDNDEIRELAEKEVYAGVIG